jgi:hypothetical protein
MGQLRERMMHDLELAGYVPKTRLIYLNSIREFAMHFRRSPADLSVDDVRTWVDRLSNLGSPSNRTEHATGASLAVARGSAACRGFSAALGGPPGAGDRQ